MVTVKVVTSIHPNFSVATDLDASMKRAHAIFCAISMAMTCSILISAVGEIAGASPMITVKELEKAWENFKLREQFFPVTHTQR